MRQRGRADINSRRLEWRMQSWMLWSIAVESLIGFHLDCSFEESVVRSSAMPSRLRVTSATSGEEMLQFRLANFNAIAFSLCLAWLAERVRLPIALVIERGLDTIMVQVLPSQVHPTSKRCRKDGFEVVGTACTRALEAARRELRLVLAACESRGAECEQSLTTLRAGDASRRLGTRRAGDSPL
jgi:hypothetical protein